MVKLNSLDCFKYKTISSVTMKLSDLCPNDQCTIIKKYGPLCFAVQFMTDQNVQGTLFIRLKGSQILMTASNLPNSFGLVLIN